MAKILCSRCGGSGYEQNEHEVGRMLRERRKRHNLSLREMAKRMKITAAYLSDLELGKRHWRAQLREKFESELY